MLMNVACWWPGQSSDELSLQSPLNRSCSVSISGRDQGHREKLPSSGPHGLSRGHSSTDARLLAEGAGTPAKLPFNRQNTGQARKLFFLTRKFKIGTAGVAGHKTFFSLIFPPFCVKKEKRSGIVFFKYFDQFSGVHAPKKWLKYTTYRIWKDPL